MEELILTQLAYNYYPKLTNSTFQKKEYKNSIEFKNLIKVVNKFKNKSLSKEIEDAITVINENYSIELINRTSYEHFDRSYSFQLIQNKSIIGNIYLSFIIPYYIIDIKKTEKSLIESLSNIIEKKIKFKKMSNVIEKKIIKHISFQDIKEGEFTIFNAFFSDEKSFLL